MVYDESIPLEEMYSVKMQSSLCRSSPPKVAIIYTTVVHQQCVTECQKHNEVKILIKNTTKLGFKNMSHIHILFTMLIILNITTNRLTASTTSKTSYMLDFNEVFLARGKTRKNAENAEKHAEKLRGKLRILKIFSRTRCVADGTHADAARGTPADTACGRQFHNADALRCGRGLFAHLFCIIGFDWNSDGVH